MLQKLVTLLGCSWLSHYFPFSVPATIAKSSSASCSLCSFYGGQRLWEWRWERGRIAKSSLLDCSLEQVHLCSGRQHRGGGSTATPCHTHPQWAALLPLPSCLPGLFLLLRMVAVAVAAAPFKVAGGSHPVLICISPSLPIDPPGLEYLWNFSSVLEANPCG